MTRTRLTFGALVGVQALHSIEEYVGRLWESFPPARFLAGLVSPDREIGFLVINIGLVAFGVWCWLVPVRRQWRSAEPLMVVWILMQCINGVGHPIWSLVQRSYTPGVITAPLLLVLAVALAVQLAKSRTSLERGVRAR